MAVEVLVAMGRGICFERNCLEGSERKFDGGAKKVGRRCVYVRILSACLPPFLPANFKEQAGRSQGFHNHVRDPGETFRILLDSYPMFLQHAKTCCLKCQNLLSNYGNLRIR